ncbi:MAG: DUF2809 domain-containing protein [Candidatus Marinimicrobia bacterium CG08_land_8_20_14_0_20_45_22]|nr:MAG: DUF2809 domain-containing protein [Candidatus Marinimicrobia bacterium CG08_land_8_20_14_0_20_45_22]
MKKFSLKYFLTILIILVITPIGFATKSYEGIGERWMHNYGGAILYEIFWCLILFLVFQKLRPYLNALYVFISTSILEIAQLWHPPFLVAIRSTYLGRTILGTTFVWVDFLYYLIGSLIGYFMLIVLNRFDLQKEKAGK